MATREATTEQELAIYKMEPGDVFSFRNRGAVSEATFVKSKQVNVVGIIDGAQYNIPKCLFIEVVKKAEKKENKPIKMKTGELFYIRKGDNALLFEFVSMNGKTIVAKDVLCGGKIRIASDMFAGTIKDYQQQQKEMTKAE